MRLRRTSAIAVAIAIAAAVAFTSAGPQESTAHSGADAAQITVAHAAITPVAGRAAAAWGDGHADDRRPSQSGLLAARAMVVAALSAAGIVVLATLAATSQARRLAVHVRGPPLPNSFA